MDQTWAESPRSLDSSQRCNIIIIIIITTVILKENSPIEQILNSGQ